MLEFQGNSGGGDVVLATTYTHSTDEDVRRIGAGADTPPDSTIFDLETSLSHISTTDEHDGGRSCWLKREREREKSSSLGRPRKSGCHDTS